VNLLGGRGPTRTGDPLGVSEVLWPAELRARGAGGLQASGPAKLSSVGRARRIALALVGLIVLALVLVQIFLPGIAASRISSRLRRYGSVQSVSVTAWPAVKLLWGDADTVKVRALRLTVTPAQTAKLLWEGRGLSRIDVTAARAQEGPLRLRDVTLRKRGSAVSAQALVTHADAIAALPPGISVALLASEGGSVKVRASGGLFGVEASVEAVAGPSEGRLIAHPLGPLLEGFHLTLFAEPHVYIEGVGASSIDTAGAQASYRLSVSARLR
jgi:hypothetical protein